MTIAVEKDRSAEKQAVDEFERLQKNILEEFGTHAPEKPKLVVKGLTTDVPDADWSSRKLYAADLKTQELYRNEKKVNQALPPHICATRITGLEPNTTYNFVLKLKTTAGLFSSDPLTVKTHTLDNLSGSFCCIWKHFERVRANIGKVANRKPYTRC